MNIALDYDDTYTADPEFWDDFIQAARKSGHRVWIVTCRRDKDENREDIGKPGGCLVIYTNLGSKRDHMERLGLRVDVWIDDMVESIIYGR